MNKTFLRAVQVVLLVFLFSFTTSNLQAPIWAIDTSHSKIGFEVNHFFTPVVGYFNDYKGELNFDPSDLNGSSVNFVVNVASVKTDSEKRDNHLQSGDFFDAEKFPEMKFSSTSFSKTDDGYIAKGELTIKETTKSIEIPFKVLGLGNHPMKSGTLMLGIKGEFTINRNDYGVGTGSWAATAVVGEEVTIKIIIEAHRKA